MERRGSGDCEIISSKVLRRPLVAALRWCAGPRTELVVPRNRECTLGVSGEEEEKDRRTLVPMAAKEAMAMGMRGLRLWRATSAGGAGWSEWQRPWGRGARLLRLVPRRVPGGLVRLGVEAGLSVAAALAPSRSGVPIWGPKSWGEPGQTAGRARGTSGKESTSHCKRALFSSRNIHTCPPIPSDLGFGKYAHHFSLHIYCNFHTGFIATSPASQLSPTEVIEMQNDLFNKEKSRQLSLTPRTEKIEVKLVGKTDPGTIFVMNKNISTPYSCAMHLSEWYCKKSVLALVDGQPWDMYKPLTKSCEIQFLTFKDRDPVEVNKAYWRSCAMIMGCAVERAFKDDYVVSLIRAPEVPVIAGAFCYDVILDKKLDEWMPTKENLRSFTKDAHALIYKDLPFETLDVDAKVALEIFQHNKYKLDFIEEKASQNPERIVKLHRFGDFIDVSEGPLIPRTSICYQYEVSVVHNLQNSQPRLVRRFQGLSLPVHLKVSLPLQCEDVTVHEPLCDCLRFEE
ncbi:39S ribosomal protein L39, mitochondrial [Galemys pyrenaicus]|uniref:Large ribosomal subunit protein mL39 n=1 Tax=Galemys pyrenaicus TaxID=202257 RepID=A0A8J6AFK5_GALPY|nr:39S ribosomal protein L39, mitochondrial [Galemys pyrenaicus]